VGQTRKALYMTLSQGQKVKGQGHKVMRRSSTKNRIYPVNVTRWWKCICLTGNRGRRSEWRGKIFERRFI